MGAIGVHHTATEDTEWDGPAAVAAMPNDADVLRYCHAWQDPDGDPDAKASFKFPHHREKGGPANLPACRNGLARLTQAKIPDADRDGVRRHLQAHLDDADDDGADDRAGGAMTAVPADLLASVNKVLQSRDARPRPALPEGRGQLKVRAAADTTELLLYDEIGYWGITATDVVKALADISSPQITLRVSSPGGDVFDGIAIFNALRGHPATVNVVVDSLAASAASFIAMAGDTITVNDAAQVMIHDASGFAYGNAADMEHMRALLDRVSDTIAGIYAGRAGGTVADWREAMRAESWFNGPEAVAAGLADAAATPPTPEPGEPNEGDEEPGEGEPEEPGAPGPNARWDLSCFTFAGRAAAPAPVLPDRTEQPEPASFDVAAFRDAMKGAFA